MPPDPKTFIGCCGAYCRTCKPFTGGICQGCKQGYDTGRRDIDRARCRIKLCCFRDRGFTTCADCPDLETCGLIGAWFAKKGHKYGRYRQSILFIRQRGYPEFLGRAEQWKGACGKLE